MKNVDVDFSTLRCDIRRLFPESDFELLSDATIAGLLEEYPDLPVHYLDFLREIGWGRLGSMHFMFYSGPIEPGEIFDSETATGLAGVLLIGDDFAGWSLGFDRSAGWQLVGIDSDSPLPRPESASTLAQFVAQRVAIASPA